MTMRSRALGMNDALGNTLAVEMGLLFKEKKIFVNYCAARANSERVLVVTNGTACVRCHRLAYFVSHVILQHREGKGWLYGVEAGLTSALGSRFRKRLRMS